MSDEPWGQFGAYQKAARLALQALQDMYDWCGKDYPGWPAVEVALKKAKDAGLTNDT